MLRLLQMQRTTSITQSPARKQENPVLSANILSKVTFYYMFRIMRKTARHGMSEDDTFEVLKVHKSGILGKRLQSLWMEEERRHTKYALQRALFKMFGTTFVSLGFFKFLEELLLLLVMPFCIGKIVEYFEAGQETVTKLQLYLFSTLVIFVLYFNALTSHTATFCLIHITMKMRIACSSLMYRKVLRLSRSAVEKVTVGNMITMLSSDVAKFEQGFFLAHFVWIAPVQTILATVLLYRQIGLNALYGIIFLLVFIPIQVFLGRMSSLVRFVIARRTDERVRLMNQLLNGIQAIKMYCWELPFAKSITIARKKEMNSVRTNAYLISLLYSFEFFITRASIFISLVTYVILGNKLSPEKIFVVASIYNVIKPTVTILFAMSIASMFGVNVSVNRIENFLRNENFNNDPTQYIPNRLKSIDPKDIEAHLILQPEKPKIIMKEISAKWFNSSEEIILKHISLEFQSSQLIAVIGPVGSGKTSLLNAILKEMIVTQGEIDIQGRISYAAQEPWFFYGSIQKNILFGEKFEKTRYDSVTNVCALASDIQMFSNGDETLVGERGKALSGGQKSRINLARCIYRKADIYLLDDPLSAVDSNVGRHLYQKCIESFLKDKICILVTHQLQYLKTAHKIIILKDGCIEACGTYEELQQTGLNFAKLLEAIQTEIEEKESKYLEKKNDVKSENISQLDRETTGRDTIDIRCYWNYLRAGGNILFILLLLLLITASHLSAFTADYFVAYWVNLEQIKVVEPRSVYPTQIERKSIIFHYLIILALTTSLAIAFCLYYARFFSIASSKIHEIILKRLIKAKMSFFSKNSIGSILNRFSKDLYIVDEHIPIVLLEVILIGCFVFGIFILACIVEPWLIIPILLLFTCIYSFRRFFIQTSRCLKRLESVARSPVLGHMTSSLEGLPTIRAFTMEKDFIEEFDRLQDNHSSTWFLFLASNRCFGLWLDLFCFTFVAISIYFILILSSGVRGGNVGLLITQYLGLIGSLQWGMRQWSELENQMISVERLLEYTSIETEPERPEKNDLIENWPNKGRIELKNLNLRYSLEEEPVLKNVSFLIDSEEKVGVVGRTGAGKSSAISALFQLYHIEGKIFIDDVDITKIPLERSRKKISIIPQEPFLFSGTLRENLDPFGRLNDEFLWKALGEVELKETIANESQGLNMLVLEAGHNFSAGQRQLICLARALLQGNRIIVMDEATANVDPYTDTLIQNTIRTRFWNCTVITVAHRLQTVMNSDKILVLRAGEVEEYDHPYVLLENPTGLFYRLLKATGENTFVRLKEMARQYYGSKYRARYIKVEPMVGKKKDNI